MQSSVIITAQFKGETNRKFKHGKSYWLHVTALPGESITVRKMSNLGTERKPLATAAIYDSAVTFLFNWTEIASYATAG